VVSTSVGEKMELSPPPPTNLRHAIDLATATIHAEADAVHRARPSPAALARQVARELRNDAVNNSLIAVAL